MPSLRLDACSATSCSFFHPEQVDIPPHQLPRDGGTCNARADELARPARVRPGFHPSAAQALAVFAPHPAMLPRSPYTSGFWGWLQDVPPQPRRPNPPHCRAAPARRAPPQPAPARRTAFSAHGLFFERYPHSSPLRFPADFISRSTDRLLRFQDSTRRRECQCTVCTGNVNFL